MADVLDADSDSGPLETTFSVMRLVPAIRMQETKS